MLDLVWDQIHPCFKFYGYSQYSIGLLAWVRVAPAQVKGHLTLSTDQTSFDPTCTSLLITATPCVAMVTDSHNSTCTFSKQISPQKCYPEGSKYPWDFCLESLCSFGQGILVNGQLITRAPPRHFLMPGSELLPTLLRPFPGNRPAVTPARLAGHTLRSCRISDILSYRSSSSLAMPSLNTTDPWSDLKCRPTP